MAYCQFHMSYHSCENSVHFNRILHTALQWSRENIDQTLTSQKTAHIPDSKVHGANMGPIWGQQDPGGPHVGPMNLLSGERELCSVCTEYFADNLPYQRLSATLQYLQCISNGDIAVMHWFIDIVVLIHHLSCCPHLFIMQRCFPDITGAATFLLPTYQCPQLCGKNKFAALWDIYATEKMLYTCQQWQSTATYLCFACEMTWYSSVSLQHSHIISMV